MAFMLNSKLKIKQHNDELKAEDEQSGGKSPPVELPDAQTVKSERSALPLLSTSSEHPLESLQEQKRRLIKDLRSLHRKSNGTTNGEVAKSSRSSDRKSSPSVDPTAESADTADGPVSTDDAKPGPLQVNLPTSVKAQKRKAIKTIPLSISDEVKQAQKREKERLERLERAKKNVPLTPSSYAPIPVPIRPPSAVPNGDDSLLEPKSAGKVKEEIDTIDDETVDEDEEEEDDEIVFVEEVKSKKKRNIEVVELSSDDSDTEVTQFSLAKRRLQPAYVRDLSPQKNSTAIEEEKKRTKRSRRKRNLDSMELTAEGRLLVNDGKPADDPDVFVSAHLTAVLQPHQLGGIRFMYDNVVESLKDFNPSVGLGCILAHAMGLGKTIQIIAFTDIFLRYTPCRRVLIICPINVIQNWLAEFEKWLPISEGRRDFNVFLLGDAAKTRTARSEVVLSWEREGGVLLMGYEMFRMLTVNRGSAKKSFEDPEELKLAATLREAFYRALVDPGPDLVVCDEGHKIKNLKAETSMALGQIRTKRRVVLTGYPLQNNLIEYYCMIDFVRPKYLGAKKAFMHMFEHPIRNGCCIDAERSDRRLANQRIHVLKEMTRGFIQRRTQNLLKAILPDSREYVVLIRKSSVQRDLYKEFVKFVQSEIGSEKTAFYNPLKAHAICSKIWNHPDLLYRAWMHQLENMDYSGMIEQFTQANPALGRANILESSTNSTQLSTFANSNQPTTSFGGFLNGCKIERNATPPSGGSYFGGHTPTNGYMKPSPPPPFIDLEPQPPIQQLQQQISHWFQPVPMQNGAHQSFFGSQQSSTFSGAQQPTLQFGQMIGGNQQQQSAVDGFWAGQNGGQTQQFAGPPAGWSGTNELSSSSSTPQPPTSQPPPARSRTVGKKKPARKKTDFDEGEDGIKYYWADPVMESYEEGMLEHSNKMRIAMAIIEATVLRGEKILLFSGSLMTLSLIEDFLKLRGSFKLPDGESFSWQRGKTYFRFDGTTSGTDRERLINKFNSDPSIRLFLISTRAGSLGVNLVSASRVIIFDCSWNPCWDQQAVCRIYRYGQKAKTFIYRLITHNCMERAIFARQISKQGLQQRVVDENLVDAKVTKNELENLIAYDELLELDVGEVDTSEWKIEDDLLNAIAIGNPKVFAECPFLHESLMLEQEDSLSAQEKLEAELLFEHEKKRIAMGARAEQNAARVPSTSQLQQVPMAGPPGIPFNGFPQPMTGPVLYQHPPQPPMFPGQPFQQQPPNFAPASSFFPSQIDLRAQGPPQFQQQPQPWYEPYNQPNNPPLQRQQLPQFPNSYFDGLGLN